MGNLLNLRYRYAEPDPPKETIMEEQFDFSRLPRAQLAALKTAAEELDLATTRQIVVALQVTDPKLSEMIDDLLQGFRFDRIVELCNASIKTNQ